MTTVRLAVFLLGSVFTTGAVAQQQSDQAVLQRMITAVQSACTETLTALVAEARAAQLAEEVQRLKGELEKAKAAKSGE